MKAAGFSVDAIPPQAAIYLTIKLDLVGKTTANGETLSATEDVAAYVLNEAKVAIVPFYAFGSPKTSPWFRLSVGTTTQQDVQDAIASLRKALEKLS
jgi:aspartate aminotransferase